jgi:ATP-dependent exoDNAse (exonuclease V) beta subunit (contains helicase and exonuclease domains)
MSGEVKWTTAQREAIDARGRNLLVSAAAGSGKTAVLTARIISRLTDKENPIDISRILAVTFTKAAASELKERISSALYKEIKKNPSDKYLNSQLMKLSKAKISTIHSFCYEIVRTHFHHFGLSTNVRIADQAESKLIGYEVMERVIDQFYASNEISDFKKFVENFVSVRDDKLAQKFYSLYEKLRSYPKGIEFVRECADTLDNSAADDFFKTKWGETFCTVTEQKLRYFLKVYDETLDYMSGSEFVTYRTAFEYDRDYIVSLLEALTAKDYKLSRQLFASYEKQSIKGRLKKELTTDELEFYKKSRTEFRELPTKIYNDFFAVSNEEIADIMTATADINRDIYTFLSAYENRLNIEKRKRGILDFSDLEQLTHKLLYSNGEVTEIALNMRDMYDEIYIDEYQDVNKLQDEIFTAVSTGNNLFMVGDIKQSIYGFRGANPTIFADYREANEGENTIYLSDNFRSDKPVIDFTNIVMSRLFTNNSGRVTYNSSDDLIYSKITDKLPQAAEVAIVIPDEIEYVCKRIHELTEQGYKYKDITLLFRSMNNAEAYKEAFERHGIPYYMKALHGFFDNAEILLMLSLLNVIDNPSRDIYLAAVLKSPLFDFTLDELVNIRNEYRNGSLYDSIRTYTEEFDFKKGKYFFNKLEQYRDYADSQPVDKLLWYLYQDTGITAYIRSEDVRYANLLLLYDYARKYENGSFKGLYNFILYINDVINREETFESAAAFEESGDIVKLMTIHQSKGLEFPVCFVCDTAKKINQRDTYDNLLLDEYSGITMKIRDDTGYAYYDTPLRQSTVLRMLNNSIDEEMRVLYVALTRAKEKLIVTASMDDADIVDNCERNSHYLSPYIMSQSPNFIKWILTTLYANGSDVSYEIKVIENVDEDFKIISEINVEREVDNTNVDEYLKVFNERFNYVYSYCEAIKLPAKLSVSELHKRRIDNDEEESITEESDTYNKPRFLDPEPDRATPAERGTATHVFMQFCDFKYVDTYGIDNEIARLCEKKYISTSDAEIINKKQLEFFFKSKLYRQIREADKVWRETRFNIQYPAGDENILVQGVIDCFFLKDNTLTLVDYKTDSFYDKTDAEQILIERHSQQLEYYRKACERLTNIKVSKAYIYSFSLGKAIELNS